MLVHSSLSFFEANLLSAQGAVLASGNATVLLSQRAVTFQSDFVPLYPIGTPMEIARIYNGKTVHRFVGKVFLSDRKLMKITSVDDELLPGAEDLYCRSMSIPVLLTAQLPTEPRKKWPWAGLRRKSPNVPQNVHARIIELTNQELIFQMDQTQAPDTAAEAKNPVSAPSAQLRAEEGQRFLISSNPPLDSTIIEVVKALYFGENPCYRCNFINFSSDNQSLLKSFLWEYTTANHKLF